MHSRNRLWVAAGVLIAWQAAAGHAIGAGDQKGAPAPPGPVPVHISGIQMVGPEQILLLLADEKEERAIPISVGRDQGIAIYLGKTKTGTPRPMTHDLLASILGALGAVVERITVTDLRDDVYIAQIDLRASGRIHAIDARPSDAIALAVRTGAPMFSAPALLRSLDALDQNDATIHADRRLGLTVQDLDRDLAESLGAPGVTGVLVASVARGGAAERTGLRRGDILKALDGRAVANVAAFQDASGADVRSFTVWREGKVTTLRTP